jgi:hypothetical protein
LQEGGVSQKIQAMESRSATILTMGRRRESTILNEKVANVHCIVDAAIQLVFATKVIDADYESLSSRHDVVCKV